MKKGFILSAFAILFSILTYAQEQKLTIDNSVYGAWRQFAPVQLSGIQPKGNSDFTYVKDYTEIYKISKTRKDNELLLNLKEINEALKLIGVEELRYFPYWDYSWKENNILTFTLNNSYFEFDMSSKKIITHNKLPENATNINICKETSYIGYLVDNNLYFNDGKGKSVKITNDEDEGIVNGSDYTHRQEFGIDKGMFWSPKGNLIAFYRKDETMVTDYPLVDVSTRIATQNNIKYPMIGEKSEEVTLGIYNLKTGSTIFADVTDFTAERYLTSITWTPDEKHIIIGVLNREQNHLKMNMYNAKTGSFVSTLFEEENPRYVEPENPLSFLKNDESKFLYFSERDGYNHLYLYNIKGELISQITKGDWLVTSLIGFDTKGENIYITATKESPIESHTYKVNLKTKKIIKLTKEAGTHSVVISNSGNYYIDSYNSNTMPSRSTIYDSKSKMVKPLLTGENKLEEYNLGEMKMGIINSADGTTDLYYRLITPPNYDPEKKYPAIIYVYGGPHAQLVTNSWLNGGLWNYYMAQKGYVILTVDNRGSSNRGFEFESIIHRQCGVEEVKDQMKGVELLKSLAFVDAERIGVYGWSYGGFMSTTLMTTHPETFKVGVAGGPVIDWKYYEVMYGERYMDTPQENPDGFEQTSLLNKAENLKGRLLMIHGYVDPVVVPQNSLDFIRSCIKADTDVDYFFYPESEHNMGGKTRIHLMRKITRYFDDFLCPDCRDK